MSPNLHLSYLKASPAWVTGTELKPIYKDIANISKS